MWQAALLGMVLGQGMRPRPRPVMFAPGVVSSAAGADAATFSPDGRLVVFDSPPTRERSILMISEKHGERWSAPRVAPFSGGGWYDQDPAMAPDGSYLIFVSNRPRPGENQPLGATAGNLWRVDRQGEGWGTPEWLPAVVNSNAHIYSPSVAADGSLYFTSSGQIYVCRRRGGTYLAAERVAVPGFATLGDPAIAPDQSFLVFVGAKQGRSNLYLTRREGAGWGPALDLRTSDGGQSTWDTHLGPGARRVYFSMLRGGVVGVWSVPLPK